MNWIKTCFVTKHPPILTMLFWTIVLEMWMVLSMLVFAVCCRKIKTDYHYDLLWVYTRFSKDADAAPAHGVNGLQCESLHCLRSGCHPGAVKLANCLYLLLPVASWLSNVWRWCHSSPPDGLVLLTQTIFAYPNVLCLSHLLAEHVNQTHPSIFRKPRSFHYTQMFSW